LPIAPLAVWPHYTWATLKSLLRDACRYKVVEPPLPAALIDELMALWMLPEVPTVVPRTTIALTRHLRAQNDLNFEACILFALPTIKRES